MKLLESREQAQAAPDNLNEYLEQTLLTAEHVSERRQHWLLLALDDARLDGQTDRRIGDLMREFIQRLEDSEDDESEYQEELDREFRRARARLLASSVGGNEVVLAQDLWENIVKCHS